MRGSSVRKKNCQQPGPNGVGNAVSLTQSPSGVGPGFWSDVGGKIYVWLFVSRLVMPTSGVGVSREPCS